MVSYLKKNIIYLLVVLIGLLQIIGGIFKSPIIQSLGFIYASSPLPLVFTSVSGYEPFAMKLTIDYTTVSGQKGTVKVTNKNYAALPGPTVMRDCYQVAFAYAPLLPENFIDTILGYGFFTKRALSKALGIQEPLHDVTIHITAVKDNKEMEWKRVLVSKL